MTKRDIFISSSFFSLSPLKLNGGKAIFPGYGIAAVPAGKRRRRTP
jgi:hypothetical protein